MEDLKIDEKNILNIFAYDYTRNSAIACFNSNILSSRTMPKGQKKTKGTPELYSEVKKLVSLSLTPTAITKLDDLAKERNLSRSEFVEQIARGLISLAQEDSLSEKFVYYPMKSVSIQKWNELPEKMGAFLISDLENFVFVDSSRNLKKRFANRKFLNEIKKSNNNSSKIDDCQIFWIECDDLKTIAKTQQELMLQFRYSSQSGKFYSEHYLPNSFHSHSKPSRLITQEENNALSNPLSIHDNDKDESK